MKNFAFLFLFLFLGVCAISQNYYYTVSKGVTDEFSMTAPGSKIMGEPANDSFTATQTLPFSWSFYGESVSQYKVSDNGFITFDLAEAANSGSNTAIPNATGPNKSIYAFWDDMELSDNPTYMTNDIKTYTVGNAPNRIHVVQWHTTPTGQTANSNYLYFALRIYEQGYFDVIFQQYRLSSGNMSATVGCDNTDGTLATMLDASPNFYYIGGQYIKENVMVYTFRYGSKPQYDIQMVKHDMAKLVHANSTYQPGGQFINHGAATITDITVNYMIDNGVTETSQISGLSLLPNESYDFTHPTSWTPTNIGDFQDVDIWISAINGNPDTIPDDNNLSAHVFVNNGNSGTKKVFIEEFSTCPCGFCPDGHIVLEDIMHRNPNIMGLIHHAGFGTDSMTINESKVIASAFTNGAPTAAIDRVHWSDQIRIAISRQIWEERALLQLAKKTAVDIDLFSTYNPTSKTMTVDVDLDFLDYPLPGDMRLNVFLVEDSVSGIGSGWDQKNYYDGTAGHPMYGRGNPIIGYTHMHVIRAVLTGDWGDNSVIPQNVLPNSSYNKTYTYQIPWYMKPKDLFLIVFVSYNDDDYIEIINAQKAERINLDVADDNRKFNQLVVYPNPAMDELYLRLDEGISSPNVQIIDQLGQHYQLKVIDNKINIADLAQGIYFIQLVDSKTIYSTTFIKN
ncbi:MAG: Omp28-related outer membrane protein [Bacteroidetes bacterium]|nr:Omp28-related outer membrane protein [Bacteroidota bacterium]